MSAVAEPAQGGELFGHPRGLTLSLRHRDVGALLLLRHARAARALHGEVPASARARAERHRLRRAEKRAGSSLFGPLDIQPLSSQIYGLYTGLVYLTPVLGGYLADRVLGQRRMVVIGAALMAIGHFMMAFEPLFLFALLVLILGNGAFKPNISTQVGTLYAPGDPRRDRAFSIFYVGINLGAFLAPLICGTLGEELGWHYGFGAAGVGMTHRACDLSLRRADAAARCAKPRAARTGKAQPFGRDEWRAIGALMLLALPVTFFWATYEQQGNTIALWADGYTDRTINLLFWSGQIPVTWFQAFNPFMIFAFTPFILALWKRQAARGREPSTVAKMALGCFGVALPYLVMVAAALSADGGKASWLWLAAYFVVITIGELYLSPVSLSLVTKVAPARAVSMMMGVWLATSFTGNFLAGYLGSFWSVMAKGSFFMMIAVIAALAGLVILAFVRPLKPILKNN